MTVAAKDGELTGIPTVLEFLNEPWRDEAACRDETDDSLFFLEMTSAAYKPHLEQPRLLAPLLICADCPVRQDCLTVGLTPYASAANDEDRTPGGQHVHGIWGGTTEYDRQRYKDVPLAEAVELLEETFPERLRARVEAWRDRVRERRANRRATTHRDRDIAARLGMELPPLGPRRIGRFHLHGRPGPGRGHRGPIAIYAAEHGCSRDTAWRRLRAP